MSKLALTPTQSVGPFFSDCLLRTGVTSEQVAANTGWELRFADSVETTPPPTREELITLRGYRNARSK